MFNKLRPARWRQWSIAALLSISAAATVAPTGAAPWSNRFQFATPSFANVWEASDRAVGEGRIARSYTWGPTPWFDYKEYYRQSPNGLRQVQYFDKARMEINDPTNSGPRGVTNGLLTVELVSGRVKLGDGTGEDQNLQRQPADVPVAGDEARLNVQAPTYASFRGVATIDNGYRDPDRTGQQVGTVLDKSGNRTNNDQLARDPLTKIVAYNTVTGHNVPQVFRDFLANGPVDGLFAFGYPISDPYWIRAKVAGADKDVFVQLYERRVVTYTPSNPEAYRVEMGNVGQHYFRWRYPHLGTPWQFGEPTPLVGFASKLATTDHWETFTMDVNGFGMRQVTSGREETVPYSWRRSYVDGATPRLITDSRRDGNLRQVFSFETETGRDVKQHTSGSEMGSNAFNAAVSPDGTQIALIHQPANASSIALIPFNANRMVPTGVLPYRDNCVYQSPTWLPDGSGLVYASNCEGGKFAIYHADIQYVYTPTDEFTPAQLVNIRKLTNTPNADNYFPRVSPDGQSIAFTSNRNGAGDIYTMNIEGRGEVRLTTDPSDEGAATWAPEGFQLIFDSNRDGDYEIYRMDLFGPTPNVVQLTSNNVDDRWPIFYQ